MGSRKLLLILIIFAGLAMVWHLNSQPPAVSTIYNDGLKQARVGNIEGLQACINSLDSRQGKHPHAAILRGYKARLDGDLTSALRFFSQGQTHDDTREVSYLEGGSICYDLKQYREAIQLFQLTLDCNSNNLDALRLLAAAYYDIGAMDRALATLAKVKTLAPDDHRPHYMQGAILQDYEQFQAATEAFKIAAGLVSVDTVEDTKVRLGWTDCLIRLGRYDEGLSVLAEADESDAVVAVRKSECLYFLRRYDEARKLLEDVLPLVYKDATAVTLAVRLCEQEEDYETGINLIETALQDSPRDVDLLSSAADIFGAAGKLDVARRYRDEAAEVGKLQQDFSVLHQQAVNNVDDAELRMKLALLAEQLGKIEIAYTWFEAAIGMAPQDSKIRIEFERFIQAHGTAKLKKRIK